MYKKKGLVLLWAYNILTDGNYLPHAQTLLCTSAKNSCYISFYSHCAVLASSPSTPS